ncbi:MAG: hypothetical protein ACYTGW_15890 [Planctomycetota bacterium]|jgi:hypothetical protein
MAPPGSMLIQANQALVDRALIQRILDTTDPEAIRDLLNWKVDMVLCMPEVPEGAEVMDSTEARTLWRQVLDHIVKHAQEYVDLWRTYHKLPPWLQDGHV